MSSLSIGLLAKKSGYSVATLRYYEQLGLIESRTRLAGQPRYFLSNTERRLQAIQLLQNLGFTLREILSLAHMTGGPALRCKKFVKKLQEKFDEVEKGLVKQRLRKKQISRTLKLCLKSGNGLKSTSIAILLGLA
jgi:MerR family copper efflux transcriptional regulator